MQELERFSLNQEIYQNSNLHPQMLELRYMGERKLMDAISRGDLPETIQCYRDFEAGTYPLTDIFQRFPEDDLRAHKNALVVLNTLCRVAAQRGGLIPFLVHLISQKYALIIERATTVRFLDQTVQPFIIADYCQAVSDYSTHCYSPMTLAVINYIVSNLPSPLEVNSLAERFYVNQSVLSRKFKKETGETITEFINGQRIKLAQYYLDSGDKSITEISFMVGYTDSNYFSRIFKRITNITPTQYMSHIKAVDIMI